MALIRTNGTTRVDQLQLHVISVALALEALEGLLVEKGWLKNDELMRRVQVLAKAKAELAELGGAVTKPTLIV